MSRRDVKDPSGRVVMQLMEYDGTMLHIRSTVDTVEHIRQLKDMPFRDSDVCVVSYPKSGTHWCYEMVDMLRNNSSEYHDRMPPLIELFPIEKLKQVHDGVYVSHLIPRHMPKDFIARKCKIIHIYRNPKDVCVSLFNFVRKTKEGELMKDMEFDVFFDLYLTGQVQSGFWAGYVKAWTNFQEENPSYPLLNICYEDMKKDLKTHVKKIADFLELDTKDELISEIAKKCEFMAMSAYKNNNIPAIMSLVTDVKDKHIMYRKGEAGDWKNWLKVAQSEAVDAAVEAANIPLEIKYT